MQFKFFDKDAGVKGKWIDDATRLVVITTNFYNPATRLVLNFRMHLSLSDTGLIVMGSRGARRRHQLCTPWRWVFCVQ